MSVTPIHSRSEPLGTYHAVSCRDATSLEHDGAPYYEVNELATADGRPLVEILLADGLWLLADPTQDLTAAFQLDSIPHKTYLAVNYGDSWNGWATPIVDRAVLSQLLSDLGSPHTWCGDSVTLNDGEQLEPFFAGLYDLEPLGWMFSRVTP